MKYYDEIQKILSKIDFQQFRPVWLTRDLVKDQNLPIKVDQKGVLRKHMHDYFAGYISYSKMLKEISKIEKNYNFKFDWDKFPKDFRNLELNKILDCKQIYPKDDKYYYDNNINLIEVFDDLNLLLGTDLSHKKWEFYVFDKWREFPSLESILAYDLITSLICYDMLGKDSEASKVLEKLELNKEDYKKFDYEWHMDNVIFGSVNKKVS